MLAFPILNRFFLLAFVGATFASVANSKKDFALFASVFLLDLGASEAILAFLGVNPQIAQGLRLAGQATGLASEATPSEGGFAAPWRCKSTGALLS